MLDISYSRKCLLLASSLRGLGAVENLFFAMHDIVTAIFLPGFAAHFSIACSIYT